MKFRNCFKTTGKHSLAVCGSFRGEIQFFLIFVNFYWFDQKQLFKHIQILNWICPFSNLLRKTNFLSISDLLSEIVTFLTKKRSFIEFPRKCFKTRGKHNLVYVAHFLEKN